MTPVTSGKAQSTSRRIDDACERLQSFGIRVPEVTNCDHASPERKSATDALKKVLGSFHHKLGNALKQAQFALAVVCNGRPFTWCEV